MTATRARMRRSRTGAWWRRRSVGALAADPAGTLRQIAAIGYRTIELAGLAGLTAARFRALAGQNRLNIVGAHMNILESGTT